MNEYCISRRIGRGRDKDIVSWDGEQERRRKQSGGVSYSRTGELGRRNVLISALVFISAIVVAFNGNIVACAKLQKSFIKGAEH